MQASTSNEDTFFTEARALFENMVGWLSSDSVCGLEHSELEKKWMLPKLPGQIQVLKDIMM